MSRAVEKFNAICEANNDDVKAKGACVGCQNAIFSIDEVAEKRFKIMKEKKLYQDYNRTKGNNGNYTFLKCYCSLLHTFIDEYKTSCDAFEEPEPAEI